MKEQVTEVEQKIKILDLAVKVTGDVVDKVAEIEKTYHRLECLVTGETKTETTNPDQVV